VQDDDNLDFPVNDLTSFLDELEAGLEHGGVPPPVAPLLTRDAIDELVNRTLDEELSRLNLPPTPPAEKK